jgi:PadR family transcriptional regulator, regulatory protein AphA
MKSKDIRLTHTSYAVLSLLNLLGEATPYELKQLLERSIENFWPIPHTTFYAEPERLTRAGYLSSEQEPDGRRRKRYALTDSGREALAEWVQDTDVAPPQYRDEGMLKIFAGADPRPIMDQRREWHIAKLAELERCLQEVRAATGPEGVEQSLLAGLTYHRQMLEPIERYLAQAATGSSQRRMIAYSVVRSAAGRPAACAAAISCSGSRRVPW